MKARNLIKFLLEDVSNRDIVRLLNKIYKETHGENSPPEFIVGDHLNEIVFATSIDKMLPGIKIAGRRINTEEFERRYLKNTDWVVSNAHHQTGYPHIEILIELEKDGNPNSKKINDLADDIQEILDSNSVTRDHFEVDLNPSGQLHIAGRIVLGSFIEFSFDENSIEDNYLTLRTRKFNSLGIEEFKEVEKTLRGFSNVMTRIKEHLL